MATGPLSCARLYRASLVLGAERWRGEDIGAGAEDSGRFLSRVHGHGTAAGIDVNIWRMPVEIPNPIPFDEDRVHRSYDRERVEAFWKILLSVNAVFEQFRAKFIGKVSPVHFFWGSFDLAVSRFSGRRAPERVGADAMTREAYSHEVSSVGFWPGAGIAGPAFYSYAAPAPKGFSEAKVQPVAARYDAQLGEFLLMYDDVRTANASSAELMAFCESTYVAAAGLGEWDRGALER